jgi:hypothetical protein
VKSFFSLSVLARDPVRSRDLMAALGGLQSIQDSLPFGAGRRVQQDIPVGVYNVIADFGQARSANTATILPNDPDLARRYGRIILLRANIMREPGRFSDVERSWRAALAPAHAEELSVEGGFYRTLWHEVGHYLGVDATHDGRDLGAALGDRHDLLEEMKADLVSLFLIEPLRAHGYHDAAAAHGVEASGILRVLQDNVPRREQPYATMQLMQWNYFLEKGLLAFDSGTGTLTIDRARYHDVVASLLAQVLELQHAGDPDAAERFITRYTAWDESLHGVIAARIRDALGHRFRSFRYAALGE